MDLRVTIVCVTYNHAKYIGQALDSFLAQKTNFKFDVLIGDDASTDDTPSILKKYARKYPDIIKPVLRQKNCGAGSNSIDLFNRVGTEYVAVCDGDDYWTDENKLQRQVDYMDEHADCSVCFHPVRVFFEGAAGKEAFFPNKVMHPYVYASVGRLSLEQIARQNFIQSSSVLYRWEFPSGLPVWYTPDIIPGDWCLMVLHAMNGYIGFIDACMSVYRRHVGGVWWESSEEILGHYRKYGLSTLYIFKCLDEYGRGRINAALSPTLKNIIGYLIVLYKQDGNKGAYRKLRTYVEIDLARYDIAEAVFSLRATMIAWSKVCIKRLIGGGVASLLKAYVFRV